ncbi:TolB-like translocation protein [Catellatospora vulcania]|uniref:hypothetical protein n=1 Tax=Catellatospora vulcania TaxID=1460450 RepID=UPI0012D4068B|nr:hypothetical protein [Catellatospora vulcania]
MTSRLSDAFDDLTAEVAPFVVRDDLGRTAWRAGRRRRTRRLLTTSSLAVTALAVLAMTVLPWAGGPRALTPAGGEAGVTGYPQRIGHQWWIGELPERPGPVAGLVEIVDQESETDGWHVFSEHGHLWRLAPHFGGTGDWPALSPDGRRLGYLTDQDGPYVIRDLATGRTTSFPSIGDATIGRPSAYLVAGQSPNFWSPDGAHLLLHASLPPVTPGAAILGMDGSVRFAPRNDLGHPAGWAGDDRLVWVKATGDDPAAPGYAVTATTTDLAGAPVGAVTLRPADGWRQDGHLNQWSPATSPDGTELLVSEYLSAGEDRAAVRRFSLSDGGERGSATVDHVTTPCGASWAGDVPAVPLNLPDTGEGYASTVLLEPAGPRRVVTADPELDTRCLIWAAGALAGEPHGWPFGLATPWWTWWWREILVGVWMLAAVASVWACRIRRPLPSPGRDRPGGARAS